MLNEEPIPEMAPATLPLLAAADLQDSLMVATNDLDRLQRLLSDATETLMGHFYAVARPRCRQWRARPAVPPVRHPAEPGG